MIFNKKQFLIILTALFLFIPFKNLSADDLPQFFVAPPPFSEGIFPCSECHAEMPVNKEQRDLDFHDEIKLQHAEKQRWCLDCHDAKNRDMLRLANGELVSFEKSYFLCGQCHGTIFRDWKVGVHGKRTGYWNDPKEYRLCVHCHYPHSPKYKPLKPLPPPQRPLETTDVKTKLIKIDDTPHPKKTDGDPVKIEISVPIKTSKMPKQGTEHHEP